MKVSEAEELICPFITDNQGYYEKVPVKCITTKCMAWKTTAKGKKEVDRVTEPYDMTPMDIRNWADRKKREGYENIGRENGFRNFMLNTKKVLKATA